MAELEMSTDKLMEAIGDPNTDQGVFDQLVGRVRTIRSLQQ